MLFGQMQELLAITIEVAVLIGTGAVEHHDQRQLRMAIPGSRNAETIRHVHASGWKAIHAMLVAFGPPLRVAGNRQLFRQFL